MRKVGFKKLNKVLVFVLVTVLFVTSSFIAQKDVNVVKASNSIADLVDNPRISDDLTTWDCVYFGNYYQALNKHQSENHEGSYLYEPIKWRVLEKKNDELFLLADQSLESIQFNEQFDKQNPDSGEMDLSWANSDLREWLNDDFYNDAFNSAEKEDINKTTVTADKPRHKPNIDEGPDTQDNVYILSAEEALSAKYGFKDTYYSTGDIGNAGPSSTRSSVNTDYCKRLHPSKSGNTNFNDPNWPQQTQTDPKSWKNILSDPYGNYKDCGIWWLRTVKSDSTPPYYMYRADYDGALKQKPGYENNACVRPVIKIDQNSTHLRYAGTTRSDGKTTGCCGDNVSYELEGNVLRIFGSGPMYDFSDFEAPWREHYEEIYTVVVEGTVSSISANALKDCDNLTYIYLNDSVNEISEDAFGGTHMHENLLISVADNSAAKSLCAHYDWNYTTVRSVNPLCQEIKEIKGTIQTADTLSFYFDNPCIGQFYEIYMDDKLIQTKTDLTGTIQCYITGIDAGLHKIKVNALVRGSKGIERRTAGSVMKINDQGFGEPEWINRSIEKVRWDTLYFGRYPQSEDPKGDYTCEDYEGRVHKYKTEPIKWRVLSHEGHHLLLLADKTLENKPFSETINGNNVWKTSTLRAWLNSTDANSDNPGFIARAFNQQEQEALIETDTPTNTTGNDTKDKVWLMSLSEARKDEYGFISTDGYARSRRANGTDYATRDSLRYDQSSTNTYLKYPWCVDVKTYKKQYKGVTAIIDPSDEYHNNATIWWLRDKNSSTCARADYPGNIDEAKDSRGLNAMVRPMIMIDDRSTDITDAGTVDSYGDTSNPDDYCNVYIDGRLSKKVKKGTTYELPENKTKRSAAPNTNLGFIDDESPDSVYHSGSSFSINRDRSFSTINVEVKPAGTAIRVVKSESHGLAFKCQTKITAVSNEGSNPIHSKAFEYGTLVTTYDDYADTYDNELDINTKPVEGHPLYNVVFKKQDFTKDPQYYIVGITNLKQHNYARDFVAKPYVIIHYEGTQEPTVVYPDDETPIFIESAKNVADRIMATPQYNSYSAWQKSWIKGYTILD